MPCSVYSVLYSSLLGNKARATTPTDCGRLPPLGASRFRRDCDPGLFFCSCLLRCPVRSICCVHRTVVACLKLVVGSSKPSSKHLDSSLHLRLIPIRLSWTHLSSVYGRPTLQTQTIPRLNAYRYKGALQTNPSFQSARPINHNIVTKTSDTATVQPEYHLLSRDSWAPLLTR